MIPKLLLSLLIIHIVFPIPTFGDHLNISLSYIESGKVREVLTTLPGDTVTLPLTQYDLHVGQDLPSNYLRFECQASYPVQWSYSGLGSPFHVISKSFRKFTNFSDPSTYSFVSHLDLTRSQEFNTGRYTCHRISQRNSNSTTFDSDTNTADSSHHINLYVPGDKVFLPMKSLTIPLLSNSTEFVVPCPVSNSRVSGFIKLYKTVKGRKPAKVTFPTVYSPRVGFTVLVNSSLSIGEYDGQYFCKESMSRRVSTTHRIQAPKESFLLISPTHNFVKIQPGHAQRFLCSAKENVTLTFVGDRKPRQLQVLFSLNETSKFPFSAEIEINPENITSEHTIINCVNSKGDVLHSWEFSTYDDVSLQKFFFDSQKRYQDARYVCCSASHYSPKFEFTFCKSETECDLKKLMFDQEVTIKETFLSEHSHRISYLNSSCVAFHPYLKYTLSSGVLRCSVKGINSGVHRDFMYYFNPYRIYQAYTDSKFDTSKVQNSESIMKLSKTPAKNTLVGEKARFLCYFSELFLSNGIVWRLIYRNGTVQLLENQKYNVISSNTSFSQIELTFTTTEIVGIQCFAPVKDSPSVWRNITGSIFVREPPQLRASIQTLDGLTVKEIEFNSSSQLILESFASSSILKNYLNSSSEQTYFVLDCNASFPVDFTYSGDGAPDIQYLPTRILNGSVLDPDSYSYSAKLRFINVDFRTVGKYLCVSSTREFGHRSQAENLNANVNVFVPGQRLFLSSENQTFKAYDYRDSVLIPCPVTDPRVKVELHKFNNETNSFDPLTPPTPTFDPLYGFSLSKNHTPSLYGLYKCVGENNQTSGVVEVYLPSDAIRATPYVRELPVPHNETQPIKCESKVNVTMTFSDDPEGLKNRPVNHSINPFSIYKYVAEYDLKVGELSGSNLTYINCTSVANSKSMHTWEFYPGDGNYIDSLTYNNVTKEFRCCTPPFRSPSIEWTNCSSITECSMKQGSCLTQNKCPPADYNLTAGQLDHEYDHRIVNGCLTFDLKERPQGLLKCVVKGVHKIVSQAVVYYYNEEKDFQVQDGYFLGTKIFDKYAIQNDKVMTLSSSPSTNATISSGSVVKFNCEGSRFFLSSSLRWGLEATNGTVFYPRGTDTSTPTKLQSELEIQFATTTWKRILCIAPNWKDYYGWRNISLPLTFADPAGSTSSTILDLD